MPMDKSLFLKEFRNGYYPVSAFFFATIMCNMLLQCFYSILLAGITYFIIGLWPSGEAFGTFFAVFLIIGLIGNCMGFALGCVFPNVQAAMSLVPMLIQPLTMFSGLLIKPDSIPIWWKWMYYCR